jgi:hypothetical protein
LHAQSASHEQGNFASPSPLVIDPVPLHSSQHFFAGANSGVFPTATHAIAASAANAAQSETLIADNKIKAQKVFIKLL